MQNCRNGPEKCLWVVTDVRTVLREFNRFSRFFFLFLSIVRQSTVLKTPTVCVATASPAKFSEAVKAAGIEMPLPPQLAQLLASPTRYTEMKKGEDWDRILRNMINDISENHCNKSFTTLSS